MDLAPCMRFKYLPRLGIVQHRPAKASTKFVDIYIRPELASVNALGDKISLRKLKCRALVCVRVCVRACDAWALYVLRARAVLVCMLCVVCVVCALCMLSVCVLCVQGRQAHALARACAIL